MNFNGLLNTIILGRISKSEWLSLYRSSIVHCGLFLKKLISPKKTGREHGNQQETNMNSLNSKFSKFNIQYYGQNSNCFLFNSSLCD